MEAPLEDIFIETVNQNIGIAHKVCRIYFPNEADREDVLQEMFYQLWRSYPAFRGESKFTTWMYRVCLNTALTYFKKSKKNQSETLSPSHQNIPDSAAERSGDDTATLYAMIERLSPLNKSIVLLYLEGYRYEEISAITGLTLSNVSVKLVRIKQELKKNTQQTL